MEHGWHLSPYCFSERGVASNWRGDGVITGFGESVAETILGLDMPKVDITVKDIPEQIPRVVVDDVRVGEKAANHFLRRGYKDFAFLFWDCVEVNQIRMEHYIATLKAAGVSEERIHVIQQPGEKVIRDWDAHCKALVEQVVALPRPLAVFTGQDNMGVTLVEACVNEGITVPDEIAVLGVDNIEILCECAVVPLSSVDTNLSTLGYMAAKQLGRLMDGEITVDEPPLKIGIGDVISRRSTDSLAVAHASVAKALKIMKAKFREGLVLEDVYEHVGLSKRGLEKAFRKHLNDSPASVLRQMRLNFVKTSLTQTDIKIGAIAMECGYSNSSNLSHAFNREVGMSPQDYRDRYRSPLIT